MSTINDTYNRVNEIETRGREIACAYGDDSAGCNTAELLLDLQQQFGPVCSFSGTYRADKWVVNIGSSTGTNVMNAIT